MTTEGLEAFGMGTKDEERLEKMKVGKNAKECFAEMDEYRKMQDGLRGQMMQLDSPEVKKSVEKFLNR